MMNLRSIVAITDFSTEANAALERAAQLAVRHRATLKLACQPAPTEQARSSASACLTHAARQLEHRHLFAARPITQVARDFERLAQDAAGADLLVLAQRRECSFKALFQGRLAERLLRISRRPVLVIKSAPYRRWARVLVAIDFAPQSRMLAEIACAIDPESQIELLHTVCTQTESKLRSADVAVGIIESHRDQLACQARERLVRFADSLGSRTTRVAHAIAHGEPGSQAAIRQGRAGADLVVVGKRRSSLLTDFLFRSVAQRVLRWATSDVLIVPHDFRSFAPAATDLEVAPERHPLFLSEAHAGSA